MGLRRQNPLIDVLGNRSLESFDVCIIGSGAGGGTAAHVLTAAGKNVLVLEAGPNPYPLLDDVAYVGPASVHSNDELKYAVRSYLVQQPLLEPRTYRGNPTAKAKIVDDVNLLPKAVGGAFQHADCKTPRFNVVDFQIRSSIESLIGSTPGLAVPGFGSDSASANFADWPLSYADLEPFYVEAEQLYGVQGSNPDENPFASWRSKPYPMPPGVPMYVGLLLAAGAQQTQLAGVPLTPHAYPAAITSRFYDGRPPCVDCGLCSGFGCPNDSKGSPAVVTLRKALLTGRCQLRFNAQAIALENDGGHVRSVLYRDREDWIYQATADAYVLAASPIESARIVLLSSTPSGGVLGNSSGQVGCNLMFHLQTLVNGFMPQRVHGQRGRAVTQGVSDLRGVEEGGEAFRVFTDGASPMLHPGGVIEFGASQGLSITEDGYVMAFRLPAGTGRRYGIGLKNAMRDGALTQHLIAMTMQAEDAPQLTNRVDLDPTVRDVFGLPVPRITYRQHLYELQTRQYYIPVMKQIVENAGAERVFVAPCDVLMAAPTSRHVMGTLRMGPDPATSVVDPDGRFHDVDNLYACDGSVFPTSSGWNPTLTIIAMALRIAHGMAGTSPASP
ncbi:MAG TPA: GMC family oxidoreductase [Myxococcota bacterium]|nr:GMC family oxidoreductase [Myxococcota bacterium]